jgi:hypothetical protein
MEEVFGMVNAAAAIHELKDYAISLIASRDGQILVLHSRQRPKAICYQIEKNLH